MEEIEQNGKLTGKDYSSTIENISAAVDFNLDLTTQQNIKKSSLALKKLKSRFENLVLLTSTLLSNFEAADDGVLIVQLDGTVLFINRACAAIWGVNPQDLQGLRAEPLFALLASKLKKPDSFLASIRHLNRFFRIPLNDIIELSDGRYIDFQINVQELERVGQSLVLIFKNRSLAVLETEPLLQTGVIEANHIDYSAELISEGFEGDVLVSESDVFGNITAVNAYFCEQFGFSAAELIGQTYRKVNANIHPNGFFKSLWDTIERGLIWQGEICNRTSTGELRWFSTTIIPYINQATLKPEKYASIQIDITDRKLQFEEGVGQAQPPLTAKLVDDTINPMVIMMNDKIVDCNNSALGYLGFQHKSELLQKDLLAISPEFQSEHLSSLAHAKIQFAIALREGSHQFVWVHQLADSTCLEADVSLTVMQLNNETIIHMQWRELGNRCKLSLALFAEKARADTAFSVVGDAVIMTDHIGIVTYLNPTAMQLSGWEQSEAIGKAIPDVFQIYTDTARETMENPVIGVLHTGLERRDIKGLLIARNGKEFHIEHAAKPMYCEDGSLLGAVLVFRDVTEKFQLLKDVHWQAGHDALTQLPNRTLLADRFGRAMNNAQRQQCLLGVCMMDLDGFKAINDLYGHEVGNQLLVNVTGRMISVIRGEDTLARIGGDEFALLIGNLYEVNELKVFLQRILTAVSAPYLIDGKLIKISASIGMTVYPMDRADPDTLIRHADHALYQAKQSGRNRIHLFDVEQYQQTLSSQQTRERVRQALLTNELCLHYQPKVNMRSGQVVGMEALLRWQHPEQGIVQPLTFLPLVEQTEVILEIGEWVIEEVLAQINRWAEEGFCCSVSINIAALHFQQANFLSRLTDILARYPQVPAHLLEIEILETVALGDIEQVRQQINACQALGVSFSLDDFGTGYSSLNYLKRLPADTLKIDQSFVRDMLDDKEDLALIEAVIGLATVFKRAVVAEGVETAEQGVLLMRLGCDLAQGFGIARPMPANEVCVWVKQFTPDPSWALWADVEWELNDFPLLVAQYDHQKWMGQLIQAVENSQTTTQRTKIQLQECRFGHWYSGWGKSKYSHLPEYSAIAPLHYRMHQMGHKIIELHSVGELETAREYCQQLQQMNDRVIVHLIALQFSVAKGGLAIKASG